MLGEGKERKYGGGNEDVREKEERQASPLGKMGFRKLVGPGKLGSSHARTHARQAGSLGEKIEPATGMELESHLTSPHPSSPILLVAGTSAIEGTYC